MKLLKPVSGKGLYLEIKLATGEAKLKSISKLGGSADIHTSNKFPPHPSLLSLVLIICLGR